MLSMLSIAFMITQDPEAYCGLLSSYYTYVAKGYISSVQRLAATRLEDAEPFGTPNESRVEARA